MFFLLARNRHTTGALAPYCWLNPTTPAEPVISRVRWAKCFATWPCVWKQSVQPSPSARPRAGEARELLECLDPTNPALLPRDDLWRDFIAGSLGQWRPGDPIAIHLAILHVPARCSTRVLSRKGNRSAWVKTNCPKKSSSPFRSEGLRETPKTGAEA